MKGYKIPYWNYESFEMKPPPQRYMGEINLGVVYLPQNYQSELEKADWWYEQGEEYTSETLETVERQENERMSEVLSQEFATRCFWWN